MSDPPTTSGRETRLLLLVIAIAIAALLVLARFRFPAASEVARVATPPPGPLDRLAAPPASFHDLESAVTALVARLEPSFVLVETEAIPPASPSRAPATPPVTPPRRLAALRVGPDRALVHLAAGQRVSSVAGSPPVPADVIVDAAHDLALVRVPVATSSATALSTGLESWPGFSYGVAFDGGRSGVNAKPVFIGRVDPITDVRWPAPLSAVGASSDLKPGALLFAMDGRFLGMAFPADDGVAIVPPAALNSVAMVLLAGK